MPKLHINGNPNMQSVDNSTFCGGSSVGMPYAEFVKRYDADDIPADACARCVKSATARAKQFVEFDAARDMDAAREAVEGSLYAWQDAANASDTPRARKHQAMAQVMLTMLEAGMQNGGARAF